jgi:hypothetical protein
MSAEAAFDALRAYKRELTGDGLSHADVDAINAIFARWHPGADRNPTALGDSSKFFDTIRPLFGSLDQSQVEGCEALLQAFGVARWPVAWAAYGMATAFHETNKTMQPVQEAFWLTDTAANAYFFKMYDPQGQRPDVAKRLGNTQPGDGAKYCGRGYVQLTGRRNYSEAGEHTGADLVEHPELALKPEIAAKIMLWGMEGGIFTGKKLADYLPLSGRAGFDAYTAARRIINGQDRAAEIAKEAQQFEAALLAGDWR